MTESIPSYDALLRENTALRLKLAEYETRIEQGRQAEEQLRVTDERSRRTAELAEVVVFDFGRDTAVGDTTDRQRTEEALIPEETTNDPTGSIRWLQTVKRPLFDEQGRATHLLGVATDITQRTLAEARFRSFTQELEARVAERTVELVNLHERDTNRIRVLLVDDHPLVREGMRGLLQEHVDVAIVGEAWDGEEAVAFVDKLRPDCVIMDVNMPKIDGIEATRRIKAVFGHTAIVGISVNTSRELEAAMRRAGADEFLSKGAPADVVYRAIVATSTKYLQKKKIEASV